MSDGIVALFDYDSFIYKSVYKVCTRQDIRKWFKQGKTKEWMKKEITDLAVNRLANMGTNLFEEIESSTGIEIGDVEYFITDCKNSIRKNLSSTYKAKRVKNKWVDMIRRFLIDSNFAHTDDEYEADDLIADRAKELGHGNYIILSLDKDLKQIPGAHFNYYKKPNKLDANGKIIEFPMTGFADVTHEEANYFFWSQMLIGDAGDNIGGLPGVGPKGAKELLGAAHHTYYEAIVKQNYMSHYGDYKMYHENYLLIKLGKK